MKIQQCMKITSIHIKEWSTLSITCTLVWHQIVSFSGHLSSKKSRPITTAGDMVLSLLLSSAYYLGRLWKITVLV
jgi:hypothetical protein